VPGGRLQWTHENGATMVGRFVELDPPHHEPGPGSGPGSSPPAAFARRGR
jgi:hypothetical protein